MTTTVACSSPPSRRSRAPIVRGLLVCLALWSYAPPAHAQTNPYGAIGPVPIPQGMLSGWAIDPDCSACPLIVYATVEYNHPGGTPDTAVLTSGLANVYRSDVGSHGFNLPFLPPLPGTHTIRVYAWDVNQMGLPTGWSSPIDTPQTYANPSVAKETGVVAFGADLFCPGKPLRLDVLVGDGPGGPFPLHNRGYTNVPPTPPEPEYPPYYVAYVPFKHPLLTSATPSIILRVTKRENCGDTFMNWNSPNNYFDSTPTPIQHDDVFRPWTENSPNETGITLETSNYKVRMDRNGGAIYEFYNKLMGAGDENAIHTHVGAAAQVAYHASRLIPGCGSVYQWNPSQAGAACQDPPSSPPKLLSPQLDEADPPNGPPGSGLTITCHYAGQPDQAFHPWSACDSNRTGLTFGGTGTGSTFRLMNWDYQEGSYPGPYYVSNDGTDGDTARLWQRVDASHPDYLVVHVKILNTGNAHTEENALIEAPVVFLTNRYTYFYMPDESGVVVPLDIAPNGWSGPGGMTACRDIGWVTAENTYPAQVLGQSVANRFITIAWFYQNEELFGTFSAAAGPCANAKVMTAIAKDKIWHNVRLGPVPRLNLTSTPVEFWYLIFPHKYDDVITIGQTQKTVKDAIAYLKANPPQ
jgi:hypothetical protein